MHWILWQEITTVVGLKLSLEKPHSWFDVYKFRRKKFQFYCQKAP